MRLYRPVLLFSTISVVLVAQGAWAVEVLFRPRVPVYGASNGARSISSADLDGDGDLDILAIDNSPLPTPDAVLWWENLGGFWSYRALDTNFERAASVAAADVDGDGDLDVVGASTDGLIVWWDNTAGNGTSWTRRTGAATIASAFLGAIAVVAADMDGDGDLDVLAASVIADDIIWWQNTAGNGTAWTARVVDADFDGPFSIAAADMDGDGDLDVVAGTNNVGGTAWWENTNAAGNGTTWTEHEMFPDFGGVSVAAADVDGDGDLDVLVALNFNKGIRWRENTLGNGSAWGERLVVDAPFNAVSVAAVDLDADGDLDVLGGGFAEQDVTWWENTAGNGTAWAEHTIDGQYTVPSWVHAADMDGDGDLDVLAASSHADSPSGADIVWYENVTVHRSAVYPAKSFLDGDQHSAVILAADLDGDGDQDVLAGDSSTDAIFWWENTAGDATAWTKRTVDPSFAGPRSVHAADMDGDGDLDVVGAALDADDIAWWENTAGNGTAWTRHNVDANFVDAFSVFAADVDGDGHQDVVGASFNSGEVAWWANTTGGGTAWTKRAVGSLAGAAAVRAADIDGDGDVDVLAAGFGAREIAWFEQTSGFSWSHHAVNEVPFHGATAVFAADMDRDGDLDLLGASYILGDVRWWKNNGSSVPWTEHDLGPLPTGETVRAADLDGDGDQDVLAAGGGVAGKVIWWENDGTACGPTCSWPARTVDADFPVARSVGVADLDGDGDLDVLGVGTNAAWWSNEGGQFALPTTDTAPPAIANGQIADLLRVDATHRGRQGDIDMQLASLELRFEEAPGDPLTTAEAGGLVQSLRIYRDDGSGQFGFPDTLVTSVGSLALDASGVQSVSFADGSTDVVVTFGTPRTYFVVVQMTANASAQTPNRFRLTHLTESSSKAEDLEFHLPLSLEYSANVSSPTVVAVALSDLIFADGFESSPVRRPDR